MPLKKTGSPLNVRLNPGGITVGVALIAIVFGIIAAGNDAPFNLGFLLAKYRTNIWFSRLIGPVIIGCVIGGVLLGNLAWRIGTESAGASDSPFKGAGPDVQLADYYGEPRFEMNVNTELRRKECIIRVVKYVGLIGLGTVVLGVIRGNLLQHPPYLVIFCCLFFAFVFCRRTRWGDKVVLSTNCVVVTRKDKILNVIHYNLIRKVSKGDNAVAIKFEGDDYTRHKAISKEGISDSTWLEFNKLLNQFVSEAPQPLLNE